MSKTNNLPYFNSPRIKNNKPLTKHSIKQKEIANFLQRKFVPKIRREMPHHYLALQVHCKKLAFIKENSKKYPYFLRFDIRLYYPSIDHQVLLEKIPENYQKLTGKPLSRKFQKYLKVIPDFLSQSPYNKGISTGSKLSYILSGIYLLGLDLNISNPFLRQTDDYIIFCKKKEDPKYVLKYIVMPHIEELNLELNEKKLSSGKFHRDRVDFIGFDFYAGYFSINKKKRERFRQKITEITHLTKKKSEKSIIKLLNNKILGFGHYYKHSSCKEDFKKLDAYIRMRLRRYLTRNKDTKNKEGNLCLSNYQIKKLGIKSLIEIKEKYDTKKRPILEKNGKKYSQTRKNVKIGNLDKLTKISEIELKYHQKLILEELKTVSGLVSKLEKRMMQAEKKLPIKTRDGDSSPHCSQVSLNFYYFSIILLLASIIILLILI